MGINWSVSDGVERADVINAQFESEAAGKFARALHGDCATVRHLCHAVRHGGGSVRVFDAVVDGEVVGRPIRVH